MKATALNPRLQSAALQRISKLRTKKQTTFQKGFTLVELMVVIVIVGILTSVALPQFLAQGVKAKGTEAKSDISGIIKNSAAEYQQGGAKYIYELATGSAPTGSAYTFTAANAATGTGTCDALGGRKASQTQKFDYFCSLTQATSSSGAGLDSGTYNPGDYILVVTAVGDSSDTALTGKSVQSAINLNNGHIQQISANTCKVFGGTNTAASSTIDGQTINCS